ncbi:ribonuclease P protein component [Curtobacterium ammoniigenes]|uniref:ribonuclease P protein component n=1 Tax=Curtobacterium ammoniigenes TaxID=395387 RepID=UPI00083298B1|nr:ribonuclease P protein component [Curtobacterium ammoniigenes]
MLARANRIVRGADYRNIVRRGRKCATAHVVVSVLTQDATDQPSRFGFIVSKAVGNAVTRNRVRRRLKAIAHDGLMPTGPTGYDVVVRALPAAAQAAWPTLFADVSHGFERGVRAAHGSRRSAHRSLENR